MVMKKVQTFSGLDFMIDHFSINGNTPAGHHHHLNSQFHYINHNFSNWTKKWTDKLSCQCVMCIDNYPSKSSISFRYIGANFPSFQGVHSWHYCHEMSWIWQMSAHPKRKSIFALFEADIWTKMRKGLKAYFRAKPIFPIYCNISGGAETWCGI